MRVFDADRDGERAAQRPRRDAPQRQLDAAVSANDVPIPG
jgi:hypothetical protein